MTAEQNFQRYTWGHGFRPDKADFALKEQATLDAINRIQRRLTGYGVTTPSTVSADSPISSSVKLTAGAAIVYNGEHVLWDSIQTVDTANATAGSIQGSTAVVTPGTIRFVIIAVRPKIVNSNQKVGKPPDSLFWFEQTSTFEMIVYMTAEQSSGTDWRGLGAINTILSSMRSSDNAEPLAVAQISFGSTSIATDKVWPFQRLLWAAGTPFDEMTFAREAAVRLAPRPVTLTSDGVIAATAAAVIGQPGRLVITGGEKILIGFKDPTRDDEIRLVKVTLPATNINFPNLSTSYIVRMYLDPDGVPFVYKGEGTWLANSPLAVDAHGTADGTGQGFPPTSIDIPLYKATTGASNGSLPTVEAIVNLSSVLALSEFEIGDLSVQNNMSVAGSVTSDLLVKGQITGSLVNKFSAAGSPSSPFTFDAKGDDDTNGNFQYLTHNGGTSFTVNFINVTNGIQLILVIVHSATFTLTWGTVNGAACVHHFASGDDQPSGSGHSKWVGDVVAPNLIFWTLTRY